MCVTLAAIIAVVRLSNASRCIFLPTTKKIPPNSTVLIESGAFRRGRGGRSTDLDNLPITSIHETRASHKIVYYVTLNEIKSTNTPFLPSLPPQLVPCPRRPHLKPPVFQLPSTPELPLQPCSKLPPPRPPPLALSSSTPPSSSPSSIPPLALPPVRPAFSARCWAFLAAPILVLWRLRAVLRCHLGMTRVL